jgi:7,8-dihydro-6-hydroxymethylpterin-pyrophosphokinase
MRVLLGLGSNLGDRRRLLAEAVDSLRGVVAVV